jgi:hypothetical protein
MLCKGYFETKYLLFHHFFNMKDFPLAIGNFYQI